MWSLIRDALILLFAVIILLVLCMLGMGKDLDALFAEEHNDI